MKLILLGICLLVFASLVGVFFFQITSGIGWMAVWDSMVTMVIPDAKPDISKAVHLNRWATEAESDRYHSVKGMPKWKILQTLGHPFQVKMAPDGSEIWWYAWGIDWQLTIEKGVCISTWSNDGY